MGFRVRRSRIESIHASERLGVGVPLLLVGLGDPSASCDPDWSRRGPECPWTQGRTRCTLIAFLLRL